RHPRPGRRGAEPPRRPRDERPRRRFRLRAPRDGRPRPRGRDRPRAAAGGPAMSLVIVERTFADPVTFASGKAAFDRQPGCLEAHQVRHLRSYFARDRKRMLCLYEAPDAESVRRVQAKVQVPFDRAWPALAIPFADAEPREGVVVVERALDPA